MNVSKDMKVTDLSEWEEESNTTDGTEAVLDGSDEDRFAERTLAALCVLAAGLLVSSGTAGISFWVGYLGNTHV